MDFFIGCFFWFMFCLFKYQKGYEFAKAGTEFIDKDKLDQTKYSVFWRLPAFIAWMPGWINDSVYFLLNEWFPIEYFDSSIQETKSRPLVLHITRLISSSMLFLIQFIREILIGGVRYYSCIYKLGFFKC
jgi:glycine betaine/proline transport system permease protein